MDGTKQWIYNPLLIVIFFNSECNDEDLIEIFEFERWSYFSASEIRFHRNRNKETRVKWKFFHNTFERAFKNIPPLLMEPSIPSEVGRKIFLIKIVESGELNSLGKNPLFALVLRGGDTRETGWDARKWTRKKFFLWPRNTRPPEINNESIKAKIKKSELIHVLFGSMLETTCFLPFLFFVISLATWFRL